jgi:hypothetical protein
VNPIVHVTNSYTSVGLVPGTDLEGAASCTTNPVAPPTSRALGGGADVHVILIIDGSYAPPTEQKKVDIKQSRPDPATAGSSPTGWHAIAINDEALTAGYEMVLTVYAVCTQ